MTSRRTKMGCLIINQKKQYLYRGLNPIGRNMDATIIIKQKEISIHHAIITIIDEENQFISDMKSSNGTFLENKHLSPYELFKLEDRAKIQFSNISAIYLKMDNADLCNIINTQCTESLTQTFFGAQTQIMENTRTEVIENNNKPDSQNSNGNIRESTILNEIETQILQPNHVSINEMQTQIIPSYYSQPTIHEMQTEDFPITQRDCDNLISEYSVRELEAEILPETQGSDKSTPNEEINEMPTQLITDKVQELNVNNATADIIDNLYEIVDDDSDGQSQLHTSQLRKLSRAYRLHSDDEKEEKNVTISRKQSINLDNVPQCSKTKDEALHQTSKSLEKTIEHEEKGYSDSSNTDIDEDKLRTRKKTNFKKKPRTSKCKSSSSEDSDFEFRKKKRLTIISDNDSDGHVVKTNNVSSESREENRLDDECSSRISTDLEDFEKIQTERTQRVGRSESISKDTHIVNINTQIEDNKSDVSTDIEENSKKKNDTLVGSRKTNTSISFQIIEDDSSTDVEGNLKITKQLSTSCITNPEESHIGWKTKSINSSILNIEDDTSTDVEDDSKKTKNLSNSRISDFDESYVKRSNVMDESEIIPETQEVFNKNFKPQEQKDNSYLDLSEIIPCTQDFSSEDFSLKMRGSSDENKECLECIEERTESGSVLEDSNVVSKREETIEKGKDAVEDDFVKSFFEDSNDSVDFLAATQVIVNSAFKPEFSFGKRGKSAEYNDGLEGQEVNFEATTQKNCEIMDKNVENDFFAPTQKIFPQVSEFKNSKSIVRNISIKDIPSTSRDSNLEICLTDINSQDFSEDFYDQTQKVDQKSLIGIKEQKLENEEFDYDGPTQKIVFEPNINSLRNNIKENVDDQTKEIKSCTSKDSKLDIKESNCGIHSDSFNFEAETEKIVIELKKNVAKENKGETTKSDQSFNFQSMKFNIQDNLKDFDEDFDAPSTELPDNLIHQNIQRKIINNSKESNLDVKQTNDLETQSFDFDIATQKIIEENVTEYSNKSTETNQSLEDITQTFDFDGPTQTISCVNQYKEKNEENFNIICESVNGENNVKAKEDFDATKKILPFTSTSNLDDFKSLNEWETQAFDFNAPTQKIIIENSNQVNELIEPNDEMKNLINLGTQSCDFDGPTQKIFSEDTKDGYQVVNEDDVTNEKVSVDVTQKMSAFLTNLREEKLSNLSNMEAQSFDFNAPTQKIDTEQILNESEDKMENVSILSTNIKGSLIKDNVDVDSSRKHCEGKSIDIKDHSDDENGYFAPNKINIGKFKQDSEDDDVDYSAPTQKVIEEDVSKKVALESDEDEVDYSAPTQKIIEDKSNDRTEKSKEDSVDDIDYSAPTQKIVEDKPTESNNYDYDYLAPTQKIIVEGSKIDSDGDGATQKKNNSIQENAKQNVDNDDFNYSAPTQIVDEPKDLNRENQNEDFEFSAPTQKIFEDPSESTENVSNIFQENSDFASSTQKILPETISLLPQKIPVSILSPRNKSANSSPKKSVSFSQIENVVTIDKKEELESQMEVIFETQNVHLIPQDEERPSNPIADVLKDITTQDVVDILGEEMPKKRMSEDSDEENDSKRRKTSHQKKTSKKGEAKGKKKRVEVDEPKRMTRSEVKVEEEMKNKIVDKNCGDGDKKIEKDIMGGLEKVDESTKKIVSNKRKSERISEQPVRRSTRRTSVEERESSKTSNIKSTLNPIAEEPSTSKNIPKISCISINELLSPSRKFTKLSMKKTIIDNDDTDEEEFEEPGEKALHIINLDDDVIESNKKKLESTMEEILPKCQRQTRNVTKNRWIKISEKSDVKMKDIEKSDDVTEENDLESKQEATIVESKTENRIASILDKEEVTFKNQSKDAESERIIPAEERPTENVSKTILFDDIEETIGERMKIRSRKKVDKKEIVIEEVPKKTVKTIQSKTLTKKNITQKSFNSEKIDIKVPKRQQQLVISDDEQLDKFVPILDINIKKKRGRKTKIKDEEFVPVASTSKESPKKTKKEEIEDVSVVSAPKRNRRILKHKVVFTMCDDPELHTIIKYLGGSIVDSVDNCTVLVTNSILRTQKLLTAVGQGKPICSPTWLHDSKKANKFMDPWENLISDPESEKKWNFSLQESFNRSRATKLFQGYSFQLLINTAADVLKGAIESCGGKVVSRAPKSGEFFVVSSKDNESKYSKFVNKGLKVVAAEAIFDGVLRQKLVFDEHYLS